MVITEQEISCVHCGEPCAPLDQVVKEEKIFCCAGCSTVYDILHVHGLENYYTINLTPGSSLKDASGESYAELDRESIRVKFIEYEDEDIVKVKFRLPQIHCSSCVWLLEKIYVLNDQIKHSRVDYVKKEVYLTLVNEDKVISSVVRTLSSLGYVPSLNVSTKGSKKKNEELRSQWIDVGVAGFVFGNIMLLSFPDYFGYQVEESFATYFAYISIFVSIPSLVIAFKRYMRSAFSSIKNKVVNIDVPISIGMLALCGYSLYEILSGTGQGYLDSFAGLLFFLLLGRLFQAKTYHHLSFDRDYKAYFPLSSTVVMNGVEERVPFSELMVGQRLRVRHGELIPADSILLTASSEIDFSFVTGESRPVYKVGGELVYAGGRVVGGSLEAEIVKEPSQSYLTRLWSHEAFQKEQPFDKLRMTSSINIISKYFTLAVLFIASVTLAYWWSIDMEKALTSFVAVLIVACPCALAITVPFTLGQAIRTLGNRGMYVKDTQVLERLADVKHVVFDKTGTLTENQMEIAGYHGKELTSEQLEMVGVLCAQSVHPLSQLISKKHPGEFVVSGFVEYPGAGITGVVNEQNVLVGSKNLMGDENQPSGTVGVCIDDDYKGCFEVVHTKREGLLKMLSDLRLKEFGLSLLSGDRKEHAQEFEPYFDQLLCEQSPEGKLGFIESHNAVAPVAMVGDGLNDAGALKASTVGISVSENSAHFTPASDAILEADRLQDFAAYIKFSKASMRLVYLGFTIALLYNVVGLFFAVTGQLTPLFSAVLMPLSSLTIVVVALAGVTLLKPSTRTH